MFRLGSAVGEWDTCPVRADAQRNVDAVVDAATAVFAESGVDAPVRAVAARAGVGVGTVYRHFPQRADLVVAVFRREVDACADAAARIAAEYPPLQALTLWLHRYTELIGAKRGLAGALHSGDPAFDALPAYFNQRLLPALTGLLATAAEAGEVTTAVAAPDLLWAVATLCLRADDLSPDYTRTMVDLLVDGLRYRAG